MTFGNRSQGLFQLAVNKMNWQEFKKYLSTHSDSQILPLWVTQLEEAVNTVQTSPKVPDPLTALMYSKDDKRFYRPQLSRVDRYRNGDSRAYIMLVTQLPSDFKHHEDLGILLASLISAGRFKFDFIDMRIKQLKVGFSDDKEFAEFGENLLNQIVGIEFESAQHGLLEPQPSINVYPEMDRTTVEGWYQEWADIRNEIFGIVKLHKNNETDMEDSRAVLEEILSCRLANLNTRFIRKASKTYYEFVEQRFPIENLESNN